MNLLCMIQHDPNTYCHEVDLTTSLFTTETKHKGSFPAFDRYLSKNFHKNFTYLSSKMKNKRNIYVCVSIPAKENKKYYSTSDIFKDFTFQVQSKSQ